MRSEGGGRVVTENCSSYFSLLLHSVETKETNMRRYDRSGNRVYPKMTVELTITSTQLDIEELTRIRKDLISYLPEDLKLTVTDIVASESLVADSTSSRKVSIKLSA